LICFAWSNPEASFNRIEGFLQRRGSSQKKLRGWWRVSDGVSAYAHEPAQQSPRRKNQNRKPKLRKTEPMQTKQSIMKSASTVVAAFGLLLMLLAVSESAHAQGTPLVFQAAGPDATSIQGAVDAFRAALGDNNLNNPGPIQKGRREINWDGGNPNLLATTAPVNPFLTFLNTRGSQFKTPGLGLSQAPPSGGPQGGLVVLFGNPSYAKIFKAFSLSRLFTPVGSNITEASFAIPGTNGNAPASVRGFGAVFTDVDQQDGVGTSTRRGSTVIEYFDKNGKLLFSSFVPAAPGDGGLSFFGIKFDDARIASVRIQAGNVAPGPNDDAQHDIVMMDDFIYGEPQILQ
jgi:hypothetical protein